MNSASFYPRFAISNLKKNRSIYLPYVLVCIIAIVMFYSLVSLIFNPSLEELQGATSLLTIFNFGLIVVGLFSTILFFYTNSFLIKRRQKEFGLYSVLGMGKSQISKMLFFESLFISIGTIIIGIALGVIISRLILLAYIKVSKLDLPIVFHISGAGIALTALLFAILFALLLIFNLLKVHVSNPISMLKGSQVGEKEPKGSWIITIIGLAALIAGYYMALTIESPLKAIGMFFIAVILVMIGTFCLFLSGSIAFLKAMRNNKSFYYKPKNFIAVSGMIYRMKQNASGLTAICLLSTMVLVTIVVTTSLYGSVDKVLGQQMKAHVEIGYDDELKEGVENLLAEYESNNNVTFTDMRGYREFSEVLQRDGNSFTERENDVRELDFSDITVMTLVSIEDINKITGEDIILNENEIVVYGRDGFEYSTFIYKGQTFNVVGDGDVSAVFRIPEVLTDTYYIAMKNEDVMKSTIMLNDEMDASELQELITNTIYFNIKPKGIGFNYVAFEKELESSLHSLSTNSSSIYPASYHIIKRDILTVYSGLLFIGIFLGIIFLAAAALIIYYKQISEGYQDHTRFEIMQKVGLSQKEVKRTINRQILIIFFLPLITAIIHVFAASKMISKIMMIFGIAEYSYTAMNIGICVVIFSILYAFIYKATAVEYYKLVE